MIIHKHYNFHQPTHACAYIRENLCKYTFFFFFTKSSVMKSCERLFFFDFYNATSRFWHFNSPFFDFTSLFDYYIFRV